MLTNRTARMTPHSGPTTSAPRMVVRGNAKPCGKDSLTAARTNSMGMVFVLGSCQEVRKEPRMAQLDKPLKLEAKDPWMGSSPIMQDYRISVLDTFATYGGSLGVRAPLVRCGNARHISTRSWPHIWKEMIHEIAKIVSSFFSNKVEVVVSDVWWKKGNANIHQGSNNATIDPRRHLHD